MAWTVSELEAWLSVHVLSSDGTSRVRNVARRYSLEDVDELQMRWYERVLRTLRNCGERAPEISDEDDARRYVYRALVRAAQDWAGSADHIHTGTAGRRRDEDLDPFEQLPASTAAPDDGATTDVAFDRVRDALWQRVRIGSPSSHGCPGRDCVMIALAVLELSTGRLETFLGEAGGGTNELDRLIHSAMGLLSPEHRPGDDGTFSQAARKRKSRCSKCVTELLHALFIAEGFGPADREELA